MMHKTFDCILYVQESTVAVRFSQHMVAMENGTLWISTTFIGMLSQLPHSHCSDKTLQNKLMQ